MGFFSNIKNRARGQIAPVMPMAPQPMPRLPVMPEIGDMRFRGRMPQKRGGLADIVRRLQQQIRNQQMPVVDTRSFPRIPVPPAASQNMIPNLDLGTPVMPEERMAPPLMNQMQGEPRMLAKAGGGEIRPGFVGGGPLVGRAANLSRQVLSKNAGRNIPDRAMPGIGDRIFNFYNPKSGLVGPALQTNRIRNTENAIMAGGGLGVAGLMDATNMFSEPASVDNIGFMSPEAMGTDLANLRVGIDRVIDLARSKASEMGADINEYVDRTRSAYDQQMENQRMQELDAQQGMRPFSFLMGPDMPLSKPEPQQRQRQESIEDILADFEKKN